MIAALVLSVLLADGPPARTGFAAARIGGKAYIIFGEGGDGRPYRTFDLRRERWADD
ncbi:MAG: hypothetical protein IH945_03905, partial [Armatimonadetes bacterium]|nr:hypothetical protein [Armatimonadota bacterium]